MGSNIEDDGRSEERNNGIHHQNDQSDEYGVLSDEEDYVSENQVNKNEIESRLFDHGEVNQPNQVIEQQNGSCSYSLVVIGS